MRERGPGERDHGSPRGPLVSDLPRKPSPERSSRIGPLLASRPGDHSSARRWRPILCLALRRLRRATSPSRIDGGPKTDPRHSLSRAHAGGAAWQQCPLLATRLPLAPYYSPPRAGRLLLAAGSRAKPRRAGRCMRRRHDRDVTLEQCILDVPHRPGKSGRELQDRCRRRSRIRKHAP